MATMEALFQLKQFYDAGYMTKEEYESKKVEMVNELTHTVRIARPAPTARFYPRYVSADS